MTEKGIKVFLVLEEKGKKVCYLEYETVNYSRNVIYGVMSRFSDNKYGISLIGKEEEKENITAKLLKYYKKELDSDKKELNKKIDLFKKINIELFQLNIRKN